MPGSKVWVQRASIKKIRPDYLPGFNYLTIVVSYGALSYCGVSHDGMSHEIPSLYRFSG